MNRANSIPRYLCLGLLAMLVLHAADVLASPDEIVVYADDMNAPGEFALEQHINYVISGTQVPAYSGELPSNHLLQFTPEFSYGITDSLEAGLYVPFAFAADGNSYFNDFRLRLKYIKPRPKDEKLFYGLNVEAGSAPLRTSENSPLLELRPIIGYRAEQWLLSFNPILSMTLGNSAGNPPQFVPSLKWLHNLKNDVNAGFEYYGDFGAWNNILPAPLLSHTVYAVVDFKTHAVDADVGIGHGFANAADAWVIKTVIAFPFN